VSKKSIYKKLMNENSFTQVPRSATDVISNNSDAFDFFTSKKVFGEAPLTSPSQLPYSSPEAKQMVEKDIQKMSKILGKASQQSIKTMMDGVKGKRYDAMDIQRAIMSGRIRDTHTGERDFLRVLWNKVRDGFRRYSKRGKLR
jgi:hypothetical protein|tara:strand:+ start:176 stop:604 length:429 start_codon:yes stop_codon:yes gene_type:complete